MKNQHTNSFQEIKQKYQKLDSTFTERGRRLWVGAEAEVLGRGGITLVHKATKVAHKTIRKGIKEINIESNLDANRSRISGGGRKAKSKIDKFLVKDILEVVEESTLGDPQAPLKWTTKSTRNIADSINSVAHRASHTTVAKILEESGYSLQGNRKTESGTEDHPDRDEQFHFINNETIRFHKEGNPVISVDTKKKEKIGNFKNSGQEYRKKGSPEKVNIYDFIDREKGKVSPYGVYDLAKNKGWVNVGISSDTAEFAVNSIRKWWKEMGSAEYKNAKEIYINADGGGSNGYRVRMWKTELQKLSNELNMKISVSHFPPGTSKWNKIEHKMFSFISRNWRARPLIDRATVVNLISNTTNKNSLKIRAALDEQEYKKGIKISDEELNKVNIEKNKFHGEWNYKIAPQSREVITLH